MTNSVNINTIKTQQQQIFLFVLLLLYMMNHINF